MICQKAKVILVSRTKFFFNWFIGCLGWPDTCWQRCTYPSDDGMEEVPWLIHSPYCLRSLGKASGHENQEKYITVNPTWEVTVLARSTWVSWCLSHKWLELSHYSMGQHSQNTVSCSVPLGDSGEGKWGTQDRSELCGWICTQGQSSSSVCWDINS